MTRIAPDAAQAPPPRDPTPDEQAFLRGRIEGLREAARIVGDFDIGQSPSGDRLLDRAATTVDRRADEWATSGAAAEGCA